ncbi:ATP synthase subunit b [Acrasis kona]|uniref:ATP synthase subunit b n=1 Tax=Acrasis kona TaxID=1008807 RepID=A0AAW2ZJW6_9EUKA
MLRNIKYIYQLAHNPIILRFSTNNILYKNEKETLLSYSEQVAKEVHSKFGDKSREEMESPEMRDEVTKIASGVRQKHIDRLLESINGDSQETKSTALDESKLSKMDLRRAEQIKMRSKQEAEQRRKQSENVNKPKKGPDVVVVKR